MTTMADPDLHTAIDHYRAGRHPEAERLCGCVLARDPNNPEALHLLGGLLAGTGRADAALAPMRRAIRARPDDPRYRLSLAGAFVALGRLEESAEQCRQALALDGDFFPAHVALSRLRFPGESYVEVLGQLHGWLAPAAYLEIGVETGKTLALTREPTVAIGVDPRPVVGVPLAATARVVTATSDDFFAGFDAARDFGRSHVDLAFIDGLHTFDQVLRDFINVERVSAPGTVIVLHDVLPLDEATAGRERRTRFWSGDTWKALIALARLRPDLAIATIAARPTGLALVTRLDPGSGVLAERFDGIVAELMTLDFCDGQAERDAAVPTIPARWEDIRAFLDGARPRPA